MILLWIPSGHSIFRRWSKITKMVNNMYSKMITFISFCLYKSINISLEWDLENALGTTYKIFFFNHWDVKCHWIQCKNSVGIAQWAIKFERKTTCKRLLDLVTFIFNLSPFQFPMLLSGSCNLVMSFFKNND